MKTFKIFENVLKFSNRVNTISPLLCRGDEVIAAASLNFDPYVARLADLMLAGEKVLKSEVQ